MFQRKTTFNELSKGFTIPCKPEVLEEIEGIVASPDFELADLAVPISHDIAISSAVLKVVNADVSGLNRTITDISQAVCFLGKEQIKTIVSICKLREHFPDKGQIKLERFWDECAETAELMLKINQWLGNRYPAEGLYSLGMFHDCGIAAMSYKYHDYMNLLQKANASPNKTLVEFEEEQYGTNHCTVGYFIASSWHFPKDLCNMILYHHDLQAIEKLTIPNVKPYTAILHIAEGLAHKIARLERHSYFEHDLEQLLGWLELSDEDMQDLEDEVEMMLH